MTATRLARLAQREQPVLERCELCGAPLPGEHRHLLDLSSRELMCACRACSTLFDRGAAGGSHYRLVPDRRLALDLVLSDELWEELRLPVDIAFLFEHSGEGRVKAYYPGPMGATESLLTLEAWEQLEAANPVLRTLEPDVEALLVNRTQGARQAWLVPLDECLKLVGVIRTHWKGLTGGREVWQELAAFFEALDRKERTR